MDISDIDEQDAKRVLAEPFWSLTDALVWVSTRNPTAICHVRRDGSDNVEEAGVVISEAWELLSAAMCGQLNAFATKTRKRWNGRSEDSWPGMLFPPEAQPGLARDYRPELENGQLVLVPKQKPFANEWFEWSEVGFSRADIIGNFPPYESTAQLEGSTAGIKTIVDAMRANKRDERVKRAVVSPQISAGEANPARPKIAVLKATLGRAIKFMKDSGYVELTRQEAQTHILPTVHPAATREPIRKASTLIDKRDKKRPPRLLADRERELLDCCRHLGGGDNVY